VTGPGPPAPLSILHVYAKGDFFTGAAVQLLQLADGLRRRGHHVVVATRPGPLWADKCRAAGISHAAIPMPSGTDLRSVRHLVQLIREHRIEVVHCHKGKARTLSLLAGLFVRIPVLVVHRGVSFPLGWNRLGYLHPRVRAIVVICRALKEGLVASGVPEGKIEVIYRGTDLDRFHPRVDGARVRRELGLADGQPLITEVGVRPEKGNDDLLDAMVSVSAKVPEARLAFVGAGAPGMEALQEAARARGLAAAVRVLGKREDMPELLAATDVLVDASYAGLGLTGVLREALAMEVPVVATDLQGNPELVIHEKTGLLVPARQPAALADAVLRMLGDPAGARAMARAGRERVQALFARGVELDHLERLYRRLLAERRGRGRARP
jgi:glycosyltransferase involved in cell wall biosynthesis